MAVSANDKLLDLIVSRSVDVSRFDGLLQAKIFDMLLASQKELAAALRAESPTGVTRTDHQQKRLAKLLAQGRDSLDSTYSSIEGVLMASLVDLAIQEGAFATKALTVAMNLGDSVNTVAVSRETLVALANDSLVMGGALTDWWDKVAMDSKVRFANAMRQGVLQGESNSSLVARISAPPSEGGMGEELTKRNAATLVRSSVNTVTNAARMEVWQANADLIKCLTWISTLDARTTKEWCIPRDKMLYDLKTLEPIGHDLPWGAGPGAIHPNCRSTSVPVLRSWEELGIKAEEASPSTRASMDGQVPDSMSYEDWLSTKSVAFQNDVLGPARANLWRDGKVDNLQQFLGKDGRFLTLDQLQEKISAMK